MLRTNRHFKGCYNCPERHELLSHGINCHTYCKAYKEAKKSLEATRSKRDINTAVSGLQDEGYKRATNGLYEKY